MSADIIDFPKPKKDEALSADDAPELADEYREAREHFHYNPDMPRWQCSCGNQLFYVSPEGVFCPNCALWAQFP